MRTARARARVVSLAICAATWCAAAASAGEALAAGRIARVLVDAGHVASAPGVSGARGTREVDLNRRLADALLEALHARQVAAGATRDAIAADARAPRETAAQLAQRARDADADTLFVSLHHDGLPQAWVDAGRAGAYRGFAVFVSMRNPRPSASMRCARDVGRALRAIGERPSRYHDTPIAGEDRPLLDARHGVHRFDELVVLRSARGPAILVEAGVLANPREEARLASDAFALRAAQAIARGIAHCMRGPPTGGRAPGEQPAGSLHG